MEVTGFVIAYNRDQILETCLQSIRWVDELIVIDKSSTDGTAAIARRYADRYVCVPWSPTVEASRAEALALATHDFIVFLDDDECLSAEAGRFLRAESRKPRARAYSLPCRQYVLGEHDGRAYYWPERHIRAFVRGAVTFNGTVHRPIVAEGTVYEVPLEGKICFHNFNHPDVRTFIEKTNRYTDAADRVGAVGKAPRSLADFARQRLDHWLERGGGGDRYVEAVAVLRAVYDMVDALKLYEAERPAGAEMFEAKLRALRTSYAAREEGRVDAGSPSFFRRLWHRGG